MLLASLQQQQLVALDVQAPRVPEWGNEVGAAGVVAAQPAWARAQQCEQEVPVRSSSAADVSVAVDDAAASFVHVVLH